MLGLVRLRRFRTPIALAIFTILLLYHFTSFRNGSGSTFAIDRLREYAAAAAPPQSADPPPAPPARAKDKPEHQAPIELETPSVPKPPPAIPPIGKPEPRPPKPAVEPVAPAPGAPTPPVLPKRPGDLKVPPKVHAPPETETEIQHWTKTPERYPVPSESIIPLPTREPRSVPQIQASFAAESETDRTTRIKRQTAVKDAFIHAWNGYKKYAWGHDEIKPVSKGFKDPFGGWGATLVDSLDTLWILGLREEFEEAIAMTATIDFRTTPMKTIPLFETVIRYVGGLLGAFDVSEGAYPVLVEKAVELADMLYGAFDTPNRMPITQFGWRAQQVAEHPSASPHASVAELGSLCLEFTRLAQITGNSTYYDAIARITNAFEEYQFNTTLPGMWPTYVDASGCQAPKPVHAKHASPAPVPPPPKGIFAEPDSESGSGSKSEKGVIENEIKISGVIGGTGKEVFLDTEKEAAPAAIAGEKADGVTEKKLDMPKVVGGSGKEVLTEGEGHVHARRELPEEDIATTTTSASTSSASPTAAATETCIPQGLTKPHLTREEKYTLGAMADSLYEYLPKQYLLMGAVPEADQYKRMYAAAIDVATKHLVFKPRVGGDPDILLSGDSFASKGSAPRLDAKSGHLQCFAGGMYAMGARIFGRTDDLSIGSRLTDGCVWAYEVMPTGIMPETFKVGLCDDPANCRFSKEEWIEEFFPKHKLPAKTKTSNAIDKRSPPIWSSSDPEVNQKAMEDYAKEVIEEEMLPPGFLMINDRRYILRPEAIESVWYMYRITGDKAWQDKGWKMFEAVENVAYTKYAHSAIPDITQTREDKHFVQADSMESFWTAETLKYYYLLFSEPDLVSLDNYVLNTEAHPFKRPDPKKA